LALIEGVYATFVRNSKLGPILHRFGEWRRYCRLLCSWPHHYSTLILGCSRCTRSPKLGSACALSL